MEPVHLEDRNILEKKYILQKNVLDSLRVYVDLNEEFLQKLCSDGILTTEECTQIQHLPWPRNRNEFLQYLVRKPWNESLLKTFLDILRQTQEPHLVGLMQSHKDEFFKEKAKALKASKRHNHSRSSARHNRKASSRGKRTENDLDKLLNKKNLSMSDQNSVRRMLNDRDKEIYQLKIENQELRSQLKEALDENTHVKHRFYLLDKAVCDLLACVDWDLDTRSATQGLNEVKDKLVSWKKTIAELQQSVSNHVIREDDLKSRLDALVNDNASLRSLKDEVESQLSSLEVKYKEEVQELTKMLEEEQGHVERLKARQRTFETRYRSAITDLQKDNRELRLQLEETNKLLQLSGSENEKYKQELHQINNKTRKLLVSLELQNEVDDIGVSLDFARNVTYAKRKSMPYGDRKLAPLKHNRSSSLVSSGVISSSGSEETSSSRSNLKQPERRSDTTTAGRKLSVGATPLAMARNRNGVYRNSMMAQNSLEGLMVTSSRK